MQTRVFSLVDHTHPATTELLNDAVVRDGLADHALTINESCNGRRDANGKSMRAMELAGTQEDGWRYIALHDQSSKRVIAL
jgi:hypothetical protein